jgi:hypothetical protein
MSSHQLPLDDDGIDWTAVAKQARAVEWNYLYGTPLPKNEEQPPVNGSSDPAIIERATRYLARMSPSIQGSNGSGALFRAAQAMIRGFALDMSDALGLLADDFNARCSPRWTVHELRRALRNAARRGRMPVGSLADRKLERRSA